MSCPRCQGLMVERPCYPRLSVPGGGNRSLYLWCCVNCGNRTDETIAFHQAQQRAVPPATREEQLWEEIVHQVQEVGAV